MFPIIPILAVIGIVGGTAALVWYSDLTPAQRRQADRLANQRFGKAFKALAESQQQQIRNRMNGSG